MKSLFTLLVFCLPFVGASQKFYVKPTIGFGNSGNNKSFGSIATVDKAKCLKGELAVGLKLNKIRLETGLGYFNWGYSLSGLVFEHDFDRQTGKIISSTSFTYDYSFIYLPLRAAYAFNILPKLSLVPSAGIDVTFNTKAESAMSISNVSSQKITAISARSMGMLGDAMLLAEFKIGKIGITAGPSFKYMLNEVASGGGEHPFLLSLDAGILYHF